MKDEKNSKAKVKENRKSKEQKQPKKKMAYLLYNGFASGIRSERRSEVRTREVRVYRTRNQVIYP